MPKKQQPERTSRRLIPDHGGVVSRTSVSLDATDVSLLADVVRGLAGLTSERVTGTDAVRLALQRLWQQMYGAGRDNVFASLGRHPEHWGQCPGCGEQPVVRGRYCPMCGCHVWSAAEIAPDSEEEVTGG